MINSFHGEHRWLSNFFPCPVVLDYMEFSSVEHAYQAAKTLDFDIRLDIKNADTPGKAKRLGKKIKIDSSYWTDEKKLTVMTDLLRQKFSNPSFKELLLSTGEQELVEGNTWGDTFWGVCNGQGKNNLGIILMNIRKELKYG